MSRKIVYFVGSEPEGATIWKPFSREQPNYCELSVQPTPSLSLEKHTVHFWNDIYYFVTGKRAIPE